MKNIDESEPLTKTPTSPSGVPPTRKVHLIQQINARNHFFALKHIPSTVKSNPPSKTPRKSLTESVPKSPNIIPPIKTKEKKS